ncbi:MAG: UDP-N-acetylmuramate--L-alanine ligase [Myxococcales bacterium]|nr:UDP-N-acetylmuramate--L-alanine ligase [Myxococcales bacterium]
MFGGSVKRIHLVGIGGSGMSGIAEVLLGHHFNVSGSDVRSSDVTAYLHGKGAQIFLGHHAEYVDGADVVVFSSAVSQTNPELEHARSLAIPVIPRAEMLAELMRLKEGIAIAGSHGKTTTTSLIATVLRAAGLDPTVIIGGRLNALGSSANLGEGDIMIAEADESDGSFLRLSPRVAVITNIDTEHLDHYGDYQGVKQAFTQFANGVPFYGTVVACLDHPGVQSILPEIDKRVVTYGLTAQADYRARSIEVEGLSMRFEVERHGESLGEYIVRMPGLHNVLNALATIAVADVADVDRSTLKEALRTFAGVARRFTVVGEKRGITVIDDYGHHPAEIRATLEAAQRAYARRVMVIFQPHRYTRTRDVFEDLTQAFNAADVLWVTDIYAAGETPIDGLNAEVLVNAIRAHGHRDVSYLPLSVDYPATIVERLEPGDVVITLGAGNITRLGPEILQSLS